MGKLQLGKLQHKVSFYRDAVIIDATNGEQVEEVQTIKENRWGSVKYIGSPSAGSSEEEINEQRTGKIKIEVVCRFFSGLKFEDWIQFEGGKFRIYSIQTLGRNEGYSLRAELRDDDTPALPTGAILDSTAQVPAATLTPLVDLTAEDIATLNHFRYDPIQDQLIADRAIETTLNSLFLGEQHKMSSGAENIFFTNLGTDINFYPMWGGLKDQSKTANQGPSGFIPPSGRIYTDLFSVPLGGDPDPLNSLPYSGPNYFGVNIAGLGITTVAAEAVPATQHLEYRLSVNGKQVYLQKLKTGNPIYVGNQIEWFFDHPVEIHAGTTIFAEIRKVVTATDTDMGQFMVQRGQTVQADGTYRYQAIVHNRLFEDKDLEFISPFLKYQAMDFAVDASTSSVLLSDLSQASTEQFLTSHPVNTLEAVANGANIRIKTKNGKKILIESMPVTGATISGVAANSVLNLAVTALNNLFTHTSAFGSSTGSGNPVTALALAGNTLTLTLTDGTAFVVDVTTLGVDENAFVTSGALTGTTLILTLTNGNTVSVDASTLGIDTNVTVSSGIVSGNDLTLTMSDSTTVVIDVSTLAVDLDTNTTVSSGAVSGTNLVLTMSDGGSISIDATQMINGSTDAAAAPDVSNQTINVTENLAFNVNVALDAGSDIVNMYGESDAPAWAVLNQATGQILGTGPAFISGGTNTYPISMKAANVLGGITTFTLTLNVLETTYTNTKSLFFENNISSYLNANAANVTDFARASNGAGAGDAWTMALWMKASNNNSGQTIFYAGSSNLANNGHIEVRQVHSGGQFRIRLRYGTSNNYLQVASPLGSLTAGTWQHVAITYDGGTTGVAQADLAASYSRFKIYIDGALQTPANNHGNYGYNGSVPMDHFRLGRFLSGNYPKGISMNQFCTWGSDQSANISGLYNAGVTQNMTSAATMNGAVNGSYVSPSHYYEITNSVTTIPDLNGSADFAGFNFAASHLVTDAP